jgi:hypothetical protein
LRDKENKKERRRERGIEIQSKKERGERREGERDQIK